MKLFQAITADPAWQPKDKLPGKSRGATKNYKTMPTPAICGLATRATPSGKYRIDGELALQMSGQVCFVADDALLGLWRLASMQTDALEVAFSWGFKDKTELVWAKYFPCKECLGTGWRLCNVICETCTFNGKKMHLAGCGTPWFGMGRTLRASHETCLIATRGKMNAKIQAHNIRSVMHAPVPWDWEKKRAIHSAKPEKFYTEIIERLVDGPYLELFGRRRRRGWTVLGNQVGKFA